MKFIYGLALVAMQYFTNTVAFTSPLIHAISLEHTKSSYYYDKFIDFKIKHHKYYNTTEEYDYRFNVFKQNLDYINNENSKSNSYKLAVNQFADMTNEEFTSIKQNPRYIQTILLNKLNRQPRSYLRNMINIPKSIDWVNEGAVTPVKNQGQCGSCWSFSTTGAIEGAHYIKTGQLVSLSEQQLMDCSTKYGNMGCNGGIPIWAYEYVIKNKGICSETEYPYYGKDSTCDVGCKTMATISSYVNVSSFSGIALKQAIAKQPVSVVIQANQLAFQFYSSGVLSASSCGNQLDHAVLAVGYGTTSDGKQYYKIKNSWGQSWGLNGYILLAADDESNKENNNSGTCGVLSMPTYPVV